jgi:cytochrome c-type biogenesis protein CcmH/NrfG
LKGYGQVLAKTGKLEKSLEAFYKALEIEPDNRFALFKSAEVLR